MTEIENKPQTCTSGSICDLVKTILTVFGGEKNRMEGDGLSVLWRYGGGRENGS